MDGFPITIKVHGPGRTFDPVVGVVASALALAGCNVDVENEYPFDMDTEKDFADLQDRPRKIILKVVHEPWGG